MWRRFVPPALRRTLATTHGPAGNLVVEEALGLRWLRCTDDGSVQGLVDRLAPDRVQIPYLRALVATLAFTPGRTILVAGLGAGALPRALLNVAPDAEIDVVEIDPFVAGAARRFLFFEESKSLQLHLDDARRFLERGGTWDLVVLDAYRGQHVPAQLNGPDFLRIVRDRLTPHGAAAANVWAPSHNPAFADTVRAWNDTFPFVWVLRRADAVNRILVGSLADHSPAELAARLAGLPNSAAVPSDAWEALESAERLTTI